MKGGKPQVQTTTSSTGPDAATNAYVQGNRGYAQGIANMPLPNLDPSTLQAIQAWMQASGLGQTGMNALTGQGNAQQQFMNPYLSTMDPLFDKLRQQSLNATRQNLTGQGAFGGSRTGVAEGTALGQIGQQQSAFNYQAFNDAMQRAQQAANLGMGANASLFNAGDYLMNRGRNWQLGGLGALESAIGPYGQSTQSRTETPTQQSPLLGMLGMIPGIGQFLGPLANVLGGGGQPSGPSGPTQQYYPDGTPR
jgi:hypothetical protein